MRKHITRCEINSIILIFNKFITNCYDNNKKKTDINNEMIKACLKLNFNIIDTYIDLIVKVVFVIFATNVSF